MDEYFLVASPHINPQKESNQRIESILFVATSGITSHRWVVQNTGALAQDMAYLVDAGRAAHIVQKLCEGSPFLFHQTFTIEQLEAWMIGRGKRI